MSYKNHFSFGKRYSDQYAVFQCEHFPGLDLDVFSKWWIHLLRRRYYAPVLLAWKILKNDRLDYRNSPLSTATEARQQNSLFGSK